LALDDEGYGALTELLDRVQQQSRNSGKISTA